MRIALATVVMLLMVNGVWKFPELGTRESWIVILGMAAFYGFFVWESNSRERDLIKRIRKELSEDKP